MKRSTVVADGDGVGEAGATVGDIARPSLWQPTTSRVASINSACLIMGPLRPTEHATHKQREIDVSTFDAYFSGEGTPLK
jgi:hypothetical protein